jgi:amidohydrolase
VRSTINFSRGVFLNKSELKRKVCEAIESQADKIIEVGNFMMSSPELGFKEFKGSARVVAELENLGLSAQQGLGVTGVKSFLPGNSTGPTVAVLGELDALTCPSHPQSDPETGAAHVCGHNAQIASMLGVAMGLVGSDAMRWLDGNVALLAVPAEEYVEIDFRMKLQEDGEIEFLGGKQELIRIGAFDDIDIAMMVHAEPNDPNRTFTVGGSSNGFLAKKVKFQGKGSHAGARPDLGINALNAAVLAIMGIHSQRETFRDEDAVRIHFVLTSGGEMVNIVPDDVQMEIFVRGKTLESIVDANEKVNRALEGGASIVGALVVWSDFPGYLPIIEELSVNSALRANAMELLEDENVISGSHRSWSTDMGDLSHIMPVVHPYIGGFSGKSHTDEFHIVDEEMAYVIPAKIMAMTLIDLLYDGGKLAKEAINMYQPRFTKEEYLTHLRT